jgi:hypothetical protein
MSVRRFPINAVLLISGLSACMDAGARAANDSAGSGPFGAGFEDLDAGTEPPGSDAAVAEDGDSSNRVQLRVVQGVLNSRASYLCHAPDFDLENADAGLEGAVELPIALADAGLEVTGYANVHSMTSGAITVHRTPSVDAGYTDAAASTDAGLADDGSAGAADAGAATPVAPRCDQASLEAVLPLPMPAAWVDPPRAEMDAGVVADGGAPAPEAGRSIEARGFVTTASGGAPLTLFGSGVLIERAALESRVEDEKKRYESLHPDDAPGALEAAARYRRVLEAAYGPRFLLSRPQPALRARSFSLHFSHLIFDVPGPSTKLDSESGALHLCITRDTMEGAELGDVGAAIFEFRNYAALGDDLDPAPSYRFRVFVQTAFAQEQKTCATTSLTPVAEKAVDPNWFEPGRSYSLIAWGALKPEEICTPLGSLIRPGCAQGVDNLRARLELIEN